MNTNYKSIILATILFFALSATTSAAPGDLDLTFGVGGIVITRGSNFNHLDIANAVAIQSDGKIVVVGDGTLGSFNWDFTVVRYNPDGSLDSSFGSTGIVVTQLSGNYDGASSVAIQADGKIVVAGSRYRCFTECAESSFAVVRYNTNGSLDPSFNGTGIVITSVGDSLWDHANSVAIQADGKIVVAGRSGRTGSNDDFAIVRYNTDGSLDTTFSGTGKVITSIGSHANSVAIQSDGKIIAAGESWNSSSAFTVVRYNTDGSLDTSFNGTGIVITSVGNSTSGARDLAIQTDGKIVAAGYSQTIPGNFITADFALVRYNPDGSLDTSFNSTGQVITSVRNSDGSAYSVAIQANGKIVAAGYSRNEIGSDFAVVRFNPNGSLDTTFNGTGKVTTGFGGQDYAVAAAIQVDGKIVVAGGTDNLMWDFYDFVVVRYQGDAATPTPTPTPTPTATSTPTPTPTPTPLPTPTPWLRGNGKIAFTSTRDVNPEIYLMDPDGTNQTRITNNNIVDDHPMWSPDGMKLAFVSQRAAGGFAIFQMNMDGTNRVEITPLSNFVNEPPWGLIGFSMSWSPDGRMIAFQENFYDDIFVVDLETHVRQDLTNHGGGAFNPAWSPDGTTILYASFRDNGPASLYAINPDGTNRRLLPGSHNGPAYSPSWSPDGTKIVFVELNGEFVESELRIANSDGTDARIFEGGYPDARNRDYPRWSPDGRKIAFNMTDDRNAQDIEIYVKNIDGTGYEQLTDTPAAQNYRPSWQPLQAAACPNPIDCADFFVRQHYLDFLNREPEAAGLAFWTNEINFCGSDTQCVEAKRINVSAAFFLSIEFQQTGYLAYRAHKAAFGDLAAKPVPVTREEMLQDMQVIGSGVVVNANGWEQKLEQNKQTFFAQLAASARFTTLYPQSLTPEQFVDTLNANAGGALSPAERNALVADLSGGAKSRAQVLRAVAEDADLLRAEFNRAFVLMQYFGYLRRNPNDPPDADFAGFNFWLAKLEQFQGNFIQAEMVKAFISSTEYRLRFGPP